MSHFWDGFEKQAKGQAKTNDQLHKQRNKILSDKKLRDAKLKRVAQQITRSGQKIKGLGGLQAALGAGAAASAVVGGAALHLHYKYRHHEKKAGSTHLTAAALGALAGGEDDYQNGGKRNRHIGAARGLGASLGAGVGAELGLKVLEGGKKKVSPAVERSIKHNLKGLGRAGAALGILGAGAAGGYHAVKHLGPKYDRERHQ